MERDRASKGNKKPRKKVCKLCEAKIVKIDYKDTNRLKN